MTLPKKTPHFITFPWCCSNFCLLLWFEKSKNWRLYKKNYVSEGQNCLAGNIISNIVYIQEEQECVRRKNIP